MQRMLKYLPVAVLSLAGTARAQQQSPLWEFGVDGALAHRTTHVDTPTGTRDVSATNVQLPIAMVRAGVYLNPQVELEPALGITHSSSGGSDFTQLDLDVGLPIYFTGTRATDQFYVRPVIGFDHFSGTGARGFTQTSLGAGLGIKLPIDSRIASRIEAQYRHGLHSDPAAAYDQFALLLGLSVYSR
ncbi:MAG TPA: hypothetical protein VHB25_06430 [Gemmatimonadaceae bacterium]|nr:hypothetical protein [Gemmatimonadaceae bacterium]